MLLVVYEILSKANFVEVLFNSIVEITWANI